MTTMQQALHIFRKDVRHLRFEIGGVLLLVLILILSGIHTWEDVQETGRASSGENPLMILLPLSWALLIARVIQTEALPGDRHFWLTRPYSRTGLVLSKLLFAAAFVHLPLLLAQAIIVAADGFPLFSSLGGLLWNQVWLAALLVLPVSAVASLTRNLAQFLPVALLTAGFLIFLIAISNESSNGGWISASLALALAGAIAIYSVWRQYQLRRGENTALRALGACVAILIVGAAFPSSAAFAIQSKLIGSPSSQFAMSVGKAEPRKPSTRTPNRYRQALRFPVEITGANARDLRFQARETEFRTLSGMRRTSWTKLETTDNGLVLVAAVDRDFFDAAKNSPVTVRGEYELTQLGDGAGTSVPLDGTPVMVPGVGQCGAAVQWDERRFYCRSAFHDPGSFASERVSGGEFGYGLPFPSLPDIYPVFGRHYQLTGGMDKELAPAAPEQPITLTARRRVAYFRYTLETRNVRLADYAVDDKDDEDEQ